MSIHIIRHSDVLSTQQNEITNSLDEQRAVIEETDPDDPEQTQLVEHLEQVQRQFEQERRPLAMRREQAIGLDYARARRIEQNNVIYWDLGGALDCNVFFFLF